MRAIFGISETSDLKTLAETGTDLSKLENIPHFRSWLNLCPTNKISGGKVISSKMMKKSQMQQARLFAMQSMGFKEVTIG